MQILERNLGDIEEIEGELKIFRSPAITSLQFFRSLRVINSTGADKYSFKIMANENLQRLWNFNEKKYLRLVRGNMEYYVEYQLFDWKYFLFLLFIYS